MGQKSNEVPKGLLNKPIGQSFPITDPIFWGPNQSTQYPDNYNQPTGWIENTLLSIPSVVRLVYGNAVAPNVPPPPPPPPPPTDRCTANTGDKSYRLIGYRQSKDGFYDQRGPETPPIGSAGSHWGCDGGTNTALKDLTAVTVVDDGPYLDSFSHPNSGTLLLSALLRMESHRRLMSQGIHNKNRAGLDEARDYPLLCSFPTLDNDERQNLQVVFADNTAALSAIPLLSEAFNPSLPTVFDPGSQHYCYYVPLSNPSTYFYFYRCRTTGFEPVGFAVQISTYIWVRTQSGLSTTVDTEIT